MHKSYPNYKTKFNFKTRSKRRKLFYDGFIEKPWQQRGQIRNACAREAILGKASLFTRSSASF